MFKQKANEEAIQALTASFGPDWKDLNTAIEPVQAQTYVDINRRVFYLDTEISWDTCEFLAKHIEYLNATSMDLTPITIKIGSNGGELTTMFTLYKILKESKIPIHTENIGGAHSAAFIIFLAGSKRTMNEYQNFIAHEGSGSFSGSYRENKSAVVAYEKDVATMREIIKERTLITEEKLEEAFSKDQDWYIDYNLAKQFGVITHDKDGNLIDSQ